MNRVRIIRGTVKDATGGEGKLTRCTVVVSDDEEIEEVEIFDGYGIGALPPDDTECIAIQAGHRTVVIATADRRSAIDKNAGDIELHVDSEVYLTLRSTGEIAVKTSGAVNIEAAQINLGDGVLQALLDARFLDYYANHTHTAPGGTTGAPLIPVVESLVSTSVVKGK